MTETERRETEPRPEYNGWRNRETWCVNLWLNNDPTTYEDCREIVAQCTDDEARDDLAQYVEDLLIDTLGDDKLATLAGDLLLASLGYVDWQSIVDAFRED